MAAFVRCCGRVIGHDGRGSILPEWEREECDQIIVTWEHTVRGHAAGVAERMIKFCWWFWHLSHQQEV